MENDMENDMDDFGNMSFDFGFMDKLKEDSERLAMA